MEKITQSHFVSKELEPETFDRRLADFESSTTVGAYTNPRLFLHRDPILYLWKDIKKKARIILQKHLQIHQKMLVKYIQKYTKKNESIKKIVKDFNLLSKIPTEIINQKIYQLLFYDFNFKKNKFEKYSLFYLTTDFFTEPTSESIDPCFKKGEICSTTLPITPTGVHIIVKSEFLTTLSISSLTLIIPSFLAVFLTSFDISYPDSSISLLNSLRL